MWKYILIFLVLFFSACSYNDSIPESKKIENTVFDHVEPLGNDWLLVTSRTEIANISPEEARDIAIQKACKSALEYYGVNVGSRTLKIQAETNNEISLDHFSNLIKLTSSGVILSKEIVQESTEVLDDHIYKSIKLKVKMGKQKGEKDPYFKVKADLNKKFFYENDQIEIEIESSIDCYITVLFISSDDNVGTVFPNRYNSVNLLSAGDKLILPTKKEKAMGLKYSVSLLPDKKEDTELIKIIATKKPITINLDNSYKTAFEALQNWLIEIPQSEIEEVDLQYVIIG